MLTKPLKAHELFVNTHTVGHRQSPWLLTHKHIIIIDRPRVVSTLDKT